MNILTYLKGITAYTMVQDNYNYISTHPDILSNALKQGLISIQNNSNDTYGIMATIEAMTLQPNRGTRIDTTDIINNNNNNDIEQYINTSPNGSPDTRNSLRLLKELEQAWMVVKLFSYQPL